MSENKKVKIEFKAGSAWKLAAIILGILFIVSVATGGLGTYSCPTGAAAKAAPTVAAPTPQQPTYVEVSEDDDSVLGDPKAPVTIIEFSDYQCPFCKRFVDQTLPEIKKEYIDKGKVKLVYRDLPLPFHQEADEAAIAAECAGDQGKYFEMHDEIFENMGAWSGNTNTKPVFLGFAEDLGLDSGDFESCYDNPATRKEVEADYADAGKAGATGTPTFFINGRKLVGAQPFAAFKAVIDDELKKA